MAIAHTNIALIKYWGKKDEALKIPFNSSLSVTLDRFYTETVVEYDKGLSRDLITLDGVLLSGHQRERVVLFMDEVRRRYGLKDFARITSVNHVPTAAGLASSASAFAALALAATKGLDLSEVELSRLARFGSGSASRSLYPGFAIWHEGTDDESSYASPIDMDPWDDFVMVVCLLNQVEKPFSSTQAMNDTVATSPYYNAWVAQAKKDMVQMIPAVIAHDIETVGTIAQRNAMAMHASLLAIDRWYFEPESLKVMNRVRDLQKRIPVYFTMDAGPNVKIMTTDAHLAELLDHLQDIDTVICHPLKGDHHED